MNKKNIAVIAGGYTSEWVVSVRSAKNIYTYIDTENYIPYIVNITKERWYVEIGEDTQIPVNKDDFSFVLNGEKIVFDFAYITIHGTPGEDGLLQGYLEMLQIPYSCCGVLASALTYDKYVCNHYLESFGINIARSIRLRNGETISNNEVADKVGLPCFIKPNAGGSSFGTTKVKTAEAIQPAIEAAFAEGTEVIIEAFMNGTEITCGCYKTQKTSVVLPITEVVSENEFFDFEAKYTPGKCNEITPARISDEMRIRVQNMTSRIYDLLGCKGIIRVDYIIMGDTPHVLEVNTTPGMTETSFIPQQVAANGMMMKNVITEIIENELTKNKNN